MKTKKISVLIKISILLTFFSCNNAENNNDESSVEIGNQTWMTDNLDVETFRNGDSILLVENFEDWIEACKNHVPACCHYKFFRPFGYKYSQVSVFSFKQVRFGKLYNEYAVKDPRGLAPSGWKIPSIKDWRKLLKHYNFQQDQSLPYRLMVNNHNIWSKTQDVPDNNGFSAMLGGSLIGDSENSENVDWPTFNGVNEYTQWWTNTKDSEVISLFKEDDNTTCVVGLEDLNNEANYVRCIKQQ
jgi:uncharacterized protein (TIGR02145 family)